VINGDEAAKILEPFVAANPDETNALSYLAWAYNIAGRRQQGMELLDASLKSHPRDLLLLSMKAHILQIDADNQDALERQGRLLTLQKKPLLAIRAFEKLLEYDRSRMQVWIQLGDAQLLTEQWQAALESFQQALALRPGAEAPFVGVMHARWKLGDAQAAHKRLSKRKNLGPKGRSLLQRIGADLNENR
jgi:tetratricopeptide (TPR) repeat protein